MSFLVSLPQNLKCFFYKIKQITKFNTPREAHDYKYTVYVFFLDKNKAFDSVDKTVYKEN